MAFLPLITLLLASARKSGLRRSLNAAEDSISTLEEATALIASLKAAAARTREAEDAASAPDFQDSASSTSQRLVYRAPAQGDEWMSALPLGNGRLGVMDFGGVSAATLQLNEHSIWNRARDPNNDPPTTEMSAGDGSLDRFRERLFNGEEAGVTLDIMNSMRISDWETRKKRSMQTLGTLKITLTRRMGSAVGRNQDELTTFRRSLDLRNAVAESRGGGKQAMVRTTFVSKEHQAIFIEVKKVCGIECPHDASIRLSRLSDRDGVQSATTQLVHQLGGALQLQLRGVATQAKAGDPDGKYGAKFLALADVVAGPECEQVEGKDGALVIHMDNACPSFVLIIAANSDYYDDTSVAGQHGLGNEAYEQRTVQQLQESRIALVRSGDFRLLQEEHSTNHRMLFDRSSIRIDAPGHIRNRVEAAAQRPTNTRVNKLRANGNAEKGESTRRALTSDPGLIELIWNYGRYLLISSSRPWLHAEAKGALGFQRTPLPANLQGIWNRHIDAPWGANYHLNINLQMNYWSSLTTDMCETQAPLWGFVEMLASRGVEHVRDVLGCRGWASTHETDAWGAVHVRAAKPKWGIVRVHIIL